MDGVLTFGEFNSNIPAVEPQLAPAVVRLTSGLVLAAPGVAVIDSSDPLVAVLVWE